MICVEIAEVAGVLQFTQVDCQQATATTFVVQTVGDLGSSFFNIPLSEAPVLLTASLALLACAYSIRAARKAVET